MNADALNAETLCCPTCGARQAVSPECRRCKCDLSFVVALHHEATSLHATCLRHLRDGAFRRAQVAAARRHALSPDATSRRLLAITSLCLEDFPAALEVSGISSD